MIGSNAFNYINVINKCADASFLRHELVSNNLSNVSTPNYKRRDIKFEPYLIEELSGSGNLDKKVANLDLSKIKATIYTDQSELSYRLDGNNVDEATENAILSENQIRYYALLDSMTQEFNRIKMVLTS